MSTFNLAILGGVVLLLVLLIARRRAERSRTSRGAGRAPAPVATAAAEAAATATAEPMGPPAPEWAAGDHAPAWTEAEVEIDVAPVWTPEEPAADDPAAAVSAPAPAAEVLHDADTIADDDIFAPAHVDEIITAPGWPLPGESDRSWTPAPAIAAPAAEVGPAWTEAEVEDLGVEEPPVHEPADEEPAIPVWQPPAEEEWQVAAPEAPAEVAPIAILAESEWQPEDEVAAIPADPPMVAYWEEDPAPVVESSPREARTAGRFALGGQAAEAGHQAVAGVPFRAPIDAAPISWCLGDEALPGRLALVLEGAVNCEAAGIEVVMDPGFAPTADGFTVRVTARAPGPFAAAGTFRVG